MRFFPLSNISIFQMEIFSAAAKELNYTHAAKRCNTTQPTVSRQISMLEETTGLILFVKTSSGKLQLTPAGRILQDSFDRILNELWESFYTAHNTQAGTRKNLHVTIPYTVDPYEHFFLMKKEYLKQRKDDEIRFEYSIQDLDKALENLLQYKTDVAIITDDYVDFYKEYPVLNISSVIKQPMSVLMLKTNPLSAYQSVPLSALKGQRLILPKDPREKSYVDMVMGYFRRAGIIPRISSYEDSFHECVLKLEASDEIVIVNKLSKKYDYSFFSCLDIENTESGYCVAWRKTDDDSPYICDFISFVKTYFSNVKTAG